MPTFVTVLTSVATALCTTLVVEYFARPALEARKLRLIRNASQIDEVIFGFQRLGMQLGSVLQQAPEGTLQQEVRTDQIAEIASTVDEIESNIARLSPRYAQSHADHLGNCSVFLGHLKGLSKRDSAGHPLPDAVVAKLGGEVSEFDVYFRANTDLRDSNEPWFKRIYWRATERAHSRQRVEEIVSKISTISRRSPEL